MTKIVIVNDRNIIVFLVSHREFANLMLFLSPAYAMLCSHRQVERAARVPHGRGERSAHGRLTRLSASQTSIGKLALLVQLLFPWPRRAIGKREDQTSMCLVLSLCFLCVLCCLVRLVCVVRLVCLVLTWSPTGSVQTLCLYLCLCYAVFTQTNRQRHRKVSLPHMWSIRH